MHTIQDGPLVYIPWCEDDLSYFSIIILRTHLLSISIIMHKVKDMNDDIIMEVPIPKHRPIIIIIIVNGK